ncbi:CHAT domain-containing protein [Streptomyces sp. NPDC127110]|uniref:CHAT domain-containing protein n=1 Tax=Streptomyces sp. NPDC127110 TaxID=3345362 RepID=UPI0036254120
MVALVTTGPCSGSGLVRSFYVPPLNLAMTSGAKGDGVRLSREVTGWAFIADVEGVRHAGLAVGLAGISPFTTGGGAGGSLFTRAYARGLPALLSLDELPFSHPLTPRWCVTHDEEGALSVLGPDGTHFVHDLDVEPPPGWNEVADASGSVMLVVSHVLPATDDPLGALVFETRRGKVCAGSVRFGEPAYETDGKPTLTFVIDPVGVLMELAQYVCDRIMSLDEATRRAREMEKTRQALAEHGTMPAAAMVDLLFRDEFLDHRGLVEFMYVYWRLVAEVADACAMEIAWRVAASQTVEAGVQLVADRCDRAVFEESEALTVQLIDRLSDPADLETALLAAARLRMATRGPEDLAADDYAREVLLTTWSARLAADLYRTWFTEEEPFQKESHRLVAEAGDLVVRALELDGGLKRPRLLAVLAQILADEHGVHRGAAGAALSAWRDSSAADEPELALFLLRTVDGVSPETTDALLTGVFGTPLADFVAAHGSTVTAKVISQGVNLARERGDRRLLRTVLDWAGQLDVRWSSAHRRQLIEARLHVLPDDPSECPGPHHGLSLSFPESWTPVQRSAALLHAAAHARDRRQPALGLTLLRRAGDGRNEELRLLTADLYYQAAEAGEPVSGPVPFPWGYYTYAARAYASLGFEELAQASLLPLVQQLGDLRGDELRYALYAIIVDAPNFDTSGRPGLGAILRDLVHSAVWQLTAESETLPMGLILGLHQAGKGSELGAWWRIEGPLVLPAHIQHFLGKLRDWEDPAATGGALPNLLNVVDADHRPGGHDNTQIARNLRWRISSFIDDELRRRSAPLIDDQRTWAKAHDLLDDRTVLLTWFLPAAVSGAAVLLAVTREGRELVVHLGEGADENGDRHPDADRVEAIRTEIERDPLFGDVTPEGGRLLESAGLPLGGSELWDKWRAKGKDRILAWPHGALHYLPLPLCRGGGRLIADDWTVTTIAGLEALAPVEVPARDCRTVVLASAAGGVPFGLHAEPALEEHARKVAEAVGAEALTGRAATRDRLRAEMSMADVVHIAVHGKLDEDAPWMHCLYLTPDGDDDGRVFAYDFLDVDLRGVRLVTLAACESALGRFDRGDNIRGIPSALITAGAQAVVGCLWPVRPEPATYFYHHLHHGVARGADPEQAFRGAQLATRAAYPHYRDWGAFTYVHGRNKGAAA